HSILMLVLSSLLQRIIIHSSFFFNDTATTEIYTLSLHDALPISVFILQGLLKLGHLVQEEVYMLLPGIMLIKKLVIKKVFLVMYLTDEVILLEEVFL